MNEFEQPADIEREIERTRERMSQNIDVLGDRLSPHNLKEQAKEALTEKAHEVASSVGKGARRTGSRAATFATRNPLPVAAVGLAAIWLLTRRVRGGTAPVRRPLRRMKREHPLAAAIASAVTGAAVRMLLAEIRRRPHVIRDTRDQPADRLQETAGRMPETATAAGRVLQETGRERL
jgi:hypothetical protein